MGGPMRKKIHKGSVQMTKSNVLLYHPYQPACFIFLLLTLWSPAPLPGADIHNSCSVIIIAMRGQRAMFTMLQHGLKHGGRCHTLVVQSAVSSHRHRL